MATIVSRLFNRARRELAGMRRRAGPQRPAGIRESVRRCAELQAAGLVPAYEAMLEEAYRKFLKAGDTVVDVGAHDGRHTAPLVALVGAGGRVIAFEPLPGKAAALRSGWLPSNVEIRELALGKEVGVASFVHVLNGEGESGLRQRSVSNLAAPEISHIEVRVSTLDSELRDLAALAYIKMDIEGGEMDCLRGGLKTIRKHRPIISVEYGGSSYTGYGVRDSDLYDFAAAESFVVTDLFGNPVASPAQWLEVANRAFWDYFLFPKEKIEIALAGLATLR